jgi:hypothetical protein
MVDKLILMIATKPINDLNFLRWHVANDATLNNPAGFTAQAPARPAPARDLEADYPLPLVAGDPIAFFINSDVNFADFADLALGYLKKEKLVRDAAATLLQVAPVPSYRIAGSFVVPAAALLPDGEYHLAIYRKSTLQALLISNPVRVINNQQWNRETAFITVSNPRNIAGYLFENMPPDYQLAFRIDGFLRNEQTPENRAAYKDLNLRSRNLRFSLERTVELELDYLDPATHTALALYLGFQEFRVDGGLYFQDGTYEREDPAGGNLLSLAKVKLIDNEFSQKIKYC